MVRRPLLLSPSSVAADQHLARRAAMNPAMLPRRKAPGAEAGGGPVVPSGAAGAPAPPPTVAAPHGVKLAADTAGAGRNGEAAAASAAGIAAKAPAQSPQLDAAGAGRSPTC